MGEKPGDRGGTPAYVAIAAALRDQIATQNLAAHTLVPSERELAEQHGVSRMTARKALALLENEGIVYRRPPRGTFVAEPRVRFRIGSFSEEVERTGRRPAARLLWAERQHPTPVVRAALDLPDDGDAHVFYRLRSIDGVPFALEMTYYPAGLTPGILDHTGDHSLWAVLRSEYGVKPAHTRAVLESVVIDEASAAHLGVRPASGGVLLTRTTTDANGQVIEYARDLYRADRVAFEVSENLD